MTTTNATLTAPMSEDVLQDDEQLLTHPTPKTKTYAPSRWTGTFLALLSGLSGFTEAEKSRWW
jgi:hypothetical protein